MFNPVQETVEGNEFRFRMELADPATLPADAAALISDMDVFLEDREIDGEDAHALRIALEELLTNLGKFGAPTANTRSAAVHVEGIVAIANDDVRLILSDDALPFDPTRYPPPDLDPETFLSRSPGGLGLHMLRQLFRDVYYRRENCRNVTVWQRRRSARVTKEG